MSKTNSHTSLTKTLQAGVVAGFVSTLVGNFLGVVTQSITGTYYIETSIAAVTLSSISLGIVASMIYYFIHGQTKFAKDIFTIFGLTLPTVITIYVLTGTYDTAFRVIAVSISYAVSLTTVILIPWLSNRYVAKAD